MFFKNYPQTSYKFGNEQSFTAIQDISAYVDLIDQIKDNINFYQKYTILDGDRPDILSAKLYGATSYYWTFFLLNDSIRQQGWPLSEQEIYTKAQVDYPNAILTTRDVGTLTAHFQVGDVVAGQSSGAIGTVIRRNVGMGQLVVSGSNGFVGTEILRDNTNPEFPQTIQLTSAVDEYLGIHHYEDATGFVDIDPYNTPSALLTPITYVDRYQNTNDALKQINVMVTVKLK